MSELALPNEIEINRRSLLHELGFTFDKPKTLAAAILKLSNFYIANPMAPTPWQEPWAQAAYLSYYLPLNFVRAREAARKASEMKFFLGLKSAIDFGSGLGSAQIAVQEVAGAEFVEMVCYDQSALAMQL